MIEVLDDTGSSNGWAVEAYLSGSSVLPPAAVLDFDGAGSSTLGDSSGAALSQFPFVSSVPSGVCDLNDNCVAPVPASSCAHGGSGPGGCPADPVTITSGAQVDLYSAAPGSGEGDVCLASGAPSGTGCAGTTPTAFFDLGLPASAAARTYSSGGIVLTVVSGP